MTRMTGVPLLLVCLLLLCSVTSTVGADGRWSVRYASISMTRLPDNDFDFTDAEWAAIGVRAGQRVSQIP